MVAWQKVFAGRDDARTITAAQVGQTHALLAPRGDVTRVDLLGDMNADSLERRAREGGRVLGTQPLPRDGDRHDEDAPDDADRIAERITDGCVRVAREPRRRIQGGRRRQCSREEARGEARGQAEKATTDESNNCTNDADERGEGQEVRLLAQVLKERRTRGNAYAVHEECEAH